MLILNIPGLITHELKNIGTIFCFCESVSISATDAYIEDVVIFGFLAVSLSQRYGNVVGRWAKDQMNRKVGKV